MLGEGRGAFYLEGRTVVAAEGDFTWEGCGNLWAFDEKDGAVGWVETPSALIKALGTHGKGIVGAFAAACRPALACAMAERRDGKAETYGTGPGV